MTTEVESDSSSGVSYSREYRSVLTLGNEAWKFQWNSKRELLGFDEWVGPEDKKKFRVVFLAVFEPAGIVDLKLEEARIEEVDWSGTKLSSIEKEAYDVLN